jgi:hypothetical protein
MNVFFSLLDLYMTLIVRHELFPIMTKLRAHFHMHDDDDDAVESMF